MSSPDRRSEKQRRRRARRVQERRAKLERHRTREQLIQDTIRDLTPAPPEPPLGPDEWRANFKFDPHLATAQQHGLMRAMAKHINSGLGQFIYGMDFGYTGKTMAMVMAKYAYKDGKLTMANELKKYKRIKDVPKPQPGKMVAFIQVLDSGEEVLSCMTSDGHVEQLMDAESTRAQLDALDKLR